MRVAFTGIKFLLYYMKIPIFVAIVEIWFLVVLLPYSILCYETIVIPDKDVQYLYERLQTAEHMSETDALNTILELENYYTGAKNDLIGEPSEMIDKAWHAHILNTPMYCSFCESTFGYYLHHTPYWTRGNDDEITQAIVSSPDFQVPMYTKLKNLGVANLNETFDTP